MLRSVYNNLLKITLTEHVSVISFLATFHQEPPRHHTPDTRRLHCCGEHSHAGDFGSAEGSVINLPDSAGRAAGLEDCECDLFVLKLLQGAFSSQAEFLLPADTIPVKWDAIFKLDRNSWRWKSSGDFRTDWYYLIIRQKFLQFRPVIVPTVVLAVLAQKAGADSNPRALVLIR